MLNIYLFGVLTNLQIRVHVFYNYLTYFSAKTYVVSTQKSSLNQTVLLSTQNTWLENNHNFTLKFFAYSGPMGYNESQVLCAHLGK